MQQYCITLYQQWGYKVKEFLAVQISKQMQWDKDVEPQRRECYSNVPIKTLIRPFFTVIL
jgi:hypothetical protein